MKSKPSKIVLELERRGFALDSGPDEYGIRYYRKESTVVSIVNGIFEVVRGGCLFRGASYDRLCSILNRRYTIEI